MFIWDKIIEVVYKEDSNLKHTDLSNLNLVHVNSEVSLTEVKGI